MSYLALRDGVPGFTKAVISLWFRVPQSSIDVVATGDRFANHLALIIPLITFSQPSDTVDMEPTTINIGTAVNFDQSGCPYVESIGGYQSVGPFFIDPCFIGINCDPDRLSAGHGKPTLVFNLQASGTAAILNYSVAVQNMAVYSLLAMPPPTVGDPDVPGNGWNSLGFPFVGLASNLVDFSDYLKAVPENFLVRSPVLITADQWHHLLLSFDLSNSCITNGPPLDSGRYATTAEGTTSWCRLWYAIDDVNCNGADNLQPFYVDGGGDLNAILTNNAWQVAHSVTDYIYNLPSDPATCTYDPVPLPTSGVAIGLPASANYVNNVHHIEMAELQMWTGVTLDTGVIANRRAFIDYKRDAMGAPIPDKNGNLTLVPVDPAKAAKLIGRIPDVELHKSGNWIKGNNTGSTGEGQDGKPISAGQFTPTGVIKKYKPDPSIVVT
jgi:hypothetical protein